MLEEDNPPEDWRENGEYLNIADLLVKTFTEGPGTRLAIWVQGCPIRCSGCWNKHMWDFSPKHIVKVEKLVEYIISFEDEIEGITLVGGEPLAQAKAVANLFKGIKDRSNLTIMLYTGYTVEQIEGKYSKTAFNIADIIIAGSYIKELRNVYLRWRGSENQKIIFHNKKYREKYSQEEGKSMVEIHINKDSGDAVLIGFPEDEIIEEVKK